MSRGLQSGSSNIPIAMPLAAASADDISNPLLTGPLRKTVFLLALPVLGEQLLNFLVGFFDVWLSGHLPGEVRTDATAAVGVAAYVGWLASLVFSLVATGTTALVSRAWGAGNRHEANQVTNRSIMLAAATGVGFLLLILPSAEWLVTMMGLRGRAAEIAVRYLRVDAIGLVFAAISMVIAAAQRGCGDMRTPMWTFGLVNVINAVVSTGLVYGWGPLPVLGVDGIVGGTLVARVAGGCLFLLGMAIGRDGLTFDSRELRFGGSLIRRILRIGAPAAAEGIVMWVGHCIFLRMISEIGQTEFAAHVVGVRVEALTYLPAVAWGAAAATMVGQSLGAGHSERAVEAGHEAAWQCSLFGIAITLWFTLGAQSIYALMHQDPEVGAVGAFPFQVVGLFQIPLILAIVYCSAMRGAGDTIFPLVITAVATYLVRLPIAYYCAFHLDLGLMGAWMGMNIDMLVRGVFSAWWFSRRRWLRAKV